MRYLVLLDYNEIYDKIEYLVSGKSGITNNASHNFVRIRIDSYDYLATEKILTFHNVIILIKSFINEDKINYYICFQKKDHIKINPICNIFK